MAASLATCGNRIRSLDLVGGAIALSYPLPMVRVGSTPAARATYSLGLGQALQVSPSRLGAAGTATIRWLCGLTLTPASKQSADSHGSTFSAGKTRFNVEAMTWVSWKRLPWRVY